MRKPQYLTLRLIFLLNSSFLQHKIVVYLLFFRKWTSWRGSLPSNDKATVAPSHNHNTTKVLQVQEPGLHICSRHSYFSLFRFCFRQEFDMQHMQNWFVKVLRDWNLHIFLRSLSGLDWSVFTLEIIYSFETDIIKTLNSIKFLRGGTAYLFEEKRRVSITKPQESQRRPYFLRAIVLLFLDF